MARIVTDRRRGVRIRRKPAEVSEDFTIAAAQDELQRTVRAQVLVFYGADRVGTFIALYWIKPGEVVVVPAG
jgi:hypothetical protein